MNKILALSAVLILVAAESFAGRWVILQWDKNKERDVIGYRVLRFYGTGTNQVDVIDVGQKTILVVSNLVSGSTNRFSVIAYASSGLESEPTPELAVVVDTNALPQAYPQSVTVSEDGQAPITLLGDDPAGEPLSFSVSSAIRGQLTGVPPTLTYHPPDNYSGQDQFAYSVSRRGATSDPAVVSITVLPVNDPPVSFARSVSCPRNGRVSIKLSGYDADGDVVRFVIAQRPSSGSLTMLLNSAVYQPNLGFSGNDSFTYVARDRISSSSPAVVNIVVTP